MLIVKADTETQKVIEQLVMCGKSVIHIMSNEDIVPLILSKIEVVGGVKYLEFDMLNAKGQAGFDKFPNKINYFGDIFTKSFWSIRRNIVCYRLEESYLR